MAQGRRQQAGRGTLYTAYCVLYTLHTAHYTLHTAAHTAHYTILCSIYARQHTSEIPLLVGNYQPAAAGPATAAGSELQKCQFWKYQKLDISTTPQLTLPNHYNIFSFAENWHNSVAKRNFVTMNNIPEDSITPQNMFGYIPLSLAPDLEPIYSFSNSAPAHCSISHSYTRLCSRHYCTVQCTVDITAQYSVQ